jgi:hypothetical protein
MQAEACFFRCQLKLALHNFDSSNVSVADDNDAIVKDTKRGGKSSVKRCVVENDEIAAERRNIHSPGSKPWEKAI